MWADEHLCGPETSQDLCDFIECDLILLVLVSSGGKKINERDSKIRGWIYQATHGREQIDLESSQKALEEHILK